MLRAWTRARSAGPVGPPAAAAPEPRSARTGPPPLLPTARKGPQPLLPRIVEKGTTDRLISNSPARGDGEPLGGDGCCVGRTDADCRAGPRRRALAAPPSARRRARHCSRTCRAPRYHVHNPCPCPCPSPCPILPPSSSLLLSPPFFFLPIINHFTSLSFLCCSSIQIP